MQVEALPQRRIQRDVFPPTRSTRYAREGADVLISNHTNSDGSTTKLPAMARRKSGDPHPYVIGTDAVRRYVKVVEECARANLLRLK